MTGDRGMNIRCSELVELLTDYLEGLLDEERRRDVEAHLDICEPCGIYLEQMRSTIRTLGHVPLDSLSAEAKATLMAAFRRNGE